MQRVCFVRLLSWAICAPMLAAPTALLAQDGSDLVQVFTLLPVTASDNGSTLSVRVPFRLLDANGAPIDNARIDGMNLRLLDMPSGAIDFAMFNQIAPVETPLYVSLLIDVSGSMESSIEAVRTAAKSAVESAPAQVRFRIVTFSGQAGDPEIRVRQDFTDDRGAIRNAIDGIINPSGGTCYYDAVNESLETLGALPASAGANARKAVIAFTDGRDMVNDPNVPCSRRTIEEVIQNARSKRIPVYTIGLLGAVEEGALQRLATDTGGSSAIGNQGQLDTLFGQAFASIINQYMAEFVVLPKEGRNRAFLEVQLAGLNERVNSTIFEFISPKSYLPTPTPIPPTETPMPLPTATLTPGVMVIFVPNAAQPNHASGLYSFNLSLSPSSLVEYVIIQVQNTNGVQVLPEPIRIKLDGRATLAFDVDMARLKADEEYIVQVMAEDANGELLTKPPQEFRINDGPQVILGELKFKHIVEQAPPLLAAIRSIRPDSERGVLLVELDINQSDQVDDYQAFINDEAGQKVVDTNMQVYPGGAEVAVPMPPAALQPVDNPQPLDFSLFIRLRTPQNIDADTQPFGFKLTPPAKPGFFATIWAGLEQNPLLAIAIVVVLSSVALWFTVGRKPARPAYSLARPAEEYTVVAGAGAGGGGGGGKKHGKLLVDVFESPSPGERTKHTFNRFPCVIGRSSQCDVRLAGDSQLSRRHAQLVLENGRILLTDLASNNGTFVDDQRIDANTATPLSDGQVIRLGRQTKIRISVSY
ncbi:MAG: FHA domain-containing protein [Caldilinea sp.]